MIERMTRDAHARRRGLERNPRPHPPLRPGKPPVATSATGYPFRLKGSALRGRTAPGVEIRELAQGFSTLAVLPPEENGQNNRS